MAEAQDTGHPVQIYVKQPDGSYILDKKEASLILHHKDVQDNPVMVVSIAGAMREGKSFLLNLFIRYLESGRDVTDWLADKESKLEGFSWKPGSERDTLGILMWSKPFLVKGPNGENVAILLMDTQGAFDNEHNMGQSIKVFTMSLMMSSYQIYNVMGSLRADKLNFFELFLEYAKLSKNETTSKVFQSLLFLIRDWPHQTNHDYGVDGGENYVRKQLKSFSVVNNNYKKDLKESFVSVNGFLMPSPGEAVAVSENNVRKFEGKLSDISPKFLTYVDKLVRVIFSKDKLIKKVLCNEEMTGKKLYTQAELVSDLLKKDELPKPQDLVQAQIEAHTISTVNELTEKYRKNIQTKQGTKPFVDDDMLRTMCENAKKSVMQELEKHRRIYGGPEAKKKCQFRLDASIQHEEERINATNRNTRNDYRQKYDDFFQSESEKVEQRLAEKFHHKCVEGETILKECQLVAEEFKRKLVGQKIGIEEFDNEFRAKIDTLQGRLREELTARNNKELEITRKTCEAKEGDILEKARTLLKDELKRNICPGDKEIEEVLSRIKKKHLKIWKSSVKYPDFVMDEYTPSLERKLDELRTVARKLNDENKTNFNRDLTLQISEMTKKYVNYMDQKTGKVAQEITQLKKYHEDCLMKVIHEIQTTDMEPALKKACDDAIRQELAKEYLSVEKRNEENKEDYERQCRIKLSDCRELARNYIKEKCRKDIKTEEELIAVHNEAKLTAIQTFTEECKDTGPKKLFQKHLSELQSDLVKLLAEAKEMNHDNERVAMAAKAEEIRTARHSYITEMSKVCGSDVPVADDRLREFHEQCMQAATNNFMKNQQTLPERMRIECKNKMKTALNQEFENIQQENRKKKVAQEQKKNQIIIQCQETYDTHMEEASKGHIMNDGELDKCHKEGYKKTTDRLKREKVGMSEKMYEEIEKSLTLIIEDRRHHFECDNQRRKEWAKKHMKEYMDKLENFYKTEIVNASEGHACSDEDLKRFHIMAVKKTEEKLSRIKIASEEIREQCENEIPVVAVEWKEEMKSQNKTRQENFLKACTDLKNKAIEEYNKEMNANAEVYLSDEEFKKNHEKARNLSLHFFEKRKSQGPASTIQDCEDKLTKELLERKTHYSSKNNDIWNRKKVEANKIEKDAKKKYNDEMKMIIGSGESVFTEQHNNAKSVAQSTISSADLPQSLKQEKIEILVRYISDTHKKLQESNQVELDRQDRDIQKYITDTCLEAYSNKMKKLCTGILTPTELNSNHKEALAVATTQFDQYSDSYQAKKRRGYEESLQKNCESKKQLFLQGNQTKQATRDKNVNTLLNAALLEYENSVSPNINGVDDAKMENIHIDGVASAQKSISDNSSKLIDENDKALAKDGLIAFLQEAYLTAKNRNANINASATATRMQILQNALEFYTEKMRSIIKNNCCVELASWHNKIAKETRLQYPSTNEMSESQKLTYQEKLEEELKDAYESITAEYNNLKTNRDKEYENLEDDRVEKYKIDATEVAKTASQNKWFSGEDEFRKEHARLKSNALRDLKFPLPECETCQNNNMESIGKEIDEIFEAQLPTAQRGGNSCCIL